MSTNGDERGLQLLELTPWQRGRGNRAKRNSFASGGDGLGALVGGLGTPISVR